jgi:hypothetical protein
MAVRRLRGRRQHDARNPQRTGHGKERAPDRLQKVARGLHRLPIVSFNKAFHSSRLTAGIVVI